MTQEEKDLLMKDLCARLPYGVKCQVQEDEYTYIGTLCRIEVDNKNCHLLDFVESMSGLDCRVYLTDVKPCLFPLTEEILDKATEESNKLYKELICSDSDLYKENNKSNILLLHAQLKSSVIKYFHIYHIDYNGLIGKGLAIDATGLNIY